MHILTAYKLTHRHAYSHTCAQTYIHVCMLSQTGIDTYTMYALMHSRSRNNIWLLDQQLLQARFGTYQSKDGAQAYTYFYVCKRLPCHASGSRLHAHRCSSKPMYISSPWNSVSWSQRILDPGTRNTNDTVKQNGCMDGKDNDSYAWRWHTGHNKECTLHTSYKGIQVSK